MLCSQKIPHKDTLLHLHLVLKIILNNIVWYLYSFWLLFVLYEVQLDNKYILLDILVCTTH